jgi:hypothetical protein
LSLGISSGLVGNPVRNNGGGNFPRQTIHCPGDFFTDLSFYSTRKLCTKARTKKSFFLFLLFFLNRNKASEVNDLEWNCVLDQGWKCFALLAGYSKAADGQPGRHSKHSQATSECLFCIIALPNGS